MDLADVWAQHKKFILAVAGSLLLLLIGQAKISSDYDYAAVEREASKVASALSSSEEVPAAAVETLDAEVRTLRERGNGLAKSMRFRLSPDFKLAATDTNPRQTFFRKLREMQRALVEAAEKQDIRVPGALGLKDTSPTEPDEIQRTLVALNVIQQVLIESISAGVRRIETIHIEDAQRGRTKSAAGFLSELHVDFVVVGGERSIRSLVAGLIDGPARGEGSYLGVDKARLKPVKGEPGMLELTLTVAALDIEASESEKSEGETP